MQGTLEQQADTYPYPVGLYFDQLTPIKLEEAMENFSRGMGYNLENSTCNFPADLEEVGEGPASSLNYIQFWSYSGNELARLSFDEFLSCLKVEVDRSQSVDPERFQNLFLLVKNKMRELEDAYEAYEPSEE